MPLDLAQAAAALEQNRPGEARPLLESATRANPRDAMAWALLARTLWTLRQPGHVEAARRAETADPANPNVQHALALYYAQSGNRKKAAQLEAGYARSAAADPAAASRAAQLDEFGATARWRHRCGRRSAISPSAMASVRFPASKLSSVRTRRKHTASWENRCYARAASPRQHGFWKRRAARFKVTEIGREWGMGALPIWQARLRQRRIILVCPEPKATGEFPIGWEVRLPRMVPKKQYYLLKRRLP